MSHAHVWGEWSLTGMSDRAAFMQRACTCGEVQTSTIQLETPSAEASARAKAIFRDREKWWGEPPESARDHREIGTWH